MCCVCLSNEPSGLLCWSITGLFIERDFSRPAHQSLGKPIRVILTSQHYKSPRANMSLLNCHSLPPCLLHPFRTRARANWDITYIYTYVHLCIKAHRWNKSHEAHVNVKKKRQLLSHSLSFFSPPSLYLHLLTPISSADAERRGGRRSLLAPRTSPRLPLNACRLSSLFSHKSAHRCCCGWWSVLSPSPPRWSNWKRKVPLLWTHVQGAMSVRQAMSYEQLINNYCFCGLPQGRSYNLQQEEDVKWVCSRDCCIRSRFFFLMTRYWGVFALLVNPNSVTMMYEAWLSY